MGGSPVLSGRVGVVAGPVQRAPSSTPSCRYGDGLALEKAELSVGGAGYDNIRETLVAWVERNPQTEFFYRRLEEAVLALNARFFRFDLSGLADFQYALYGGPEGGHFEWHKDYGRDPADPAPGAAQADLVAAAQRAVRL